MRRPLIPSRRPTVDAFEQHTDDALALVAHRPHPTATATASRPRPPSRSTPPRTTAVPRCHPDPHQPQPADTPAPHDRTTPAPDERRARVYVRAALGEHPPRPDAHSAAQPHRTFDLSWITADRLRLTAFAGAALAQPTLYSIAADSTPLTPVGLTFMASITTALLYLRRRTAPIRWLFLFTTSAGVLYGPGGLILVGAITGVS